MRSALALLFLVACGNKSADKPSVHATAAFVDITVVPMDSEHELAHQTVLIDGDKIVAIGKDLAVPDGAQKIAGAGKWLVPGLVDMHVHFNDERDGALYIANGVTTVRNMWGSPLQLEMREKAKKRDPKYFGPSIYTAGPITDGDPPTWPGSTVVHDAAEATAAVDEQKREGYDFVKVYDNLTLAAYDAIAAETKQVGMRFAGHMPGSVPLEHAIVSGQASVEHLTGYITAAQDATSQGLTMKGAAQRTEMIKHLDFAKLPALAKQTASAKLVNCPTLTVLSRFGELDHPELLMARPENKFVSPTQLEEWNPKNDFRLAKMTPEAFADLRNLDGFRSKLVKALLDAGAPILAGTDTPNPFVVPGFSLHEELGRLVAAGLTPYQALQAATANAADWIGDPTIGRIAVNGRADLVVLDADPLHDIAATTKRTGVMVRGEWLTTKQLDDKLTALVASYQQPVDRLAKAPPLEVPAGEVELRATFHTKLGTRDIGVERMAVVKTPTGRIIVAQQGSDPPSPALSTMKLELDKTGALVSYTLTEDGKTATATPVNGKLHIAATKTSDHDLVAIDGNMISLMIPMIGHPAVTAVQIAGDGTLTDVKYTFDSGKVTIEGGGQKTSGTLAVDDKGFPLHLSLTFPFGTITVDR